MRGARAVQLLAGDSSVTLEEALAYAVDTGCYGYERWVTALTAAHGAVGGGYGEDADYQRLLRGVTTWEGRADAGSIGALQYWYWRQALRQGQGRVAQAVQGKLDDPLAAVGRGRGTPASLSEAEQRALVEALAQAAAALRRDHGRLDVRFGDVFRVGRGDRSWPVGGGSQDEVGMGTLRAIGFEAPREDKTRWGRGGQTSTQVIALTTPIQSWTQPPIGQSDRPDSPHYRDQAEQLFSPGRLKPTWYRKEELLGHVKSRTELRPRGR